VAGMLTEFTSGSFDLDAAQRIGINEPTLSMKQTGKSLRKHILRGTAASTMQPVV
jgi:hypothetical protein